MWLTVQDVDGTHLWEASNIEMELRALGQGNMAHPTQGQFCDCGDIKNRYNVDPDFSRKKSWDLPGSVGESDKQAD